MSRTCLCNGKYYLGGGFNHEIYYIPMPKIIREWNIFYGRREKKTIRWNIPNFQGEIIPPVPIQVEYKEWSNFYSNFIIIKRFTIEQNNAVEPMKMGELLDKLLPEFPKDDIVSFDIHSRPDMFRVLANKQISSKESTFFKYPELLDIYRKYTELNPSLPKITPEEYYQYGGILGTHYHIGRIQPNGLINTARNRNLKKSGMNRVSTDLFTRIKSRKSRARTRQRKQRTSSLSILR